MSYVRELRKLVGNRPLILPGSVVLVFNQDGELLLQHRTDGTWGVPGGLMELGESLEEVARREVKEETGLNIGELQLVDVCSGPEYYLKLPNGDELYSVTAVYVAKEVTGKLVMDRSESVELAYFPIEQLPENMNEANRSYVDTYLKKFGSR